MIKSFQARRASLAQSSVRHGIAPSLKGEPADFRYCEQWGQKVLDNFCRGCWRERDREWDRAATRAACVKANRP